MNSPWDNTQAFHLHISRKNRNASAKRSHLGMAGCFPQDISVMASSFLSTETFVTAAVEMGGVGTLKSQRKHLF
jgi:hypothetical protein